MKKTMATMTVDDLVEMTERVKGVPEELLDLVDCLEMIEANDNTAVEVSVEAPVQTMDGPVAIIFIGFNVKNVPAARLVRTAYSVGMGDGRRWGAHVVGGVMEIEVRVPAGWVDEA